MAPLANPLTTVHAVCVMHTDYRDKLTPRDLGACWNVIGRLVRQGARTFFLGAACAVRSGSGSRCGPVAGADKARPGSLDLAE